MSVITDISTLITCPDGTAPGELVAIPGGAIAWDEWGVIEWVGPGDELPAKYSDDRIYSAGGKLVVPGLIDCHTHLAFGGWRAEEFALRSKGASYLDIARSGGGILSTVQATRLASFDELLVKSRQTLVQMLRLGVTSVEAKSGYGLNLENEIKLLKVYRELAHQGPQ